MSEQLVFQAITRGNSMEWLTLTGLNPNVINASTPLTAQDEEILATHICALGDSAAWARGDMGLYVREKIKRTVEAQGLSRDDFNAMWGTELERLSKLLGCATKTLYNNISTCSQWPIEARRNTLSVRYKHHEMLPASMPLADRIRMIEQADSEGWNYKRFYAVVHGHILADTGEPTETYQAPQPIEIEDDPAVYLRDDFDADFSGNEEFEEDLDTYESTVFPHSAGASGASASGASCDYGQQAVSLHIISNSGGVDMVVDRATEPMKFCFVFTNGATFEVTPDLLTGSLNIRKLEPAGA